MAYNQKHWPLTPAFEKGVLCECPGADSNRYAFRHHPLKMACLPISPPGQTTTALVRRTFETAAQALFTTKKTGPTGLEPATSRVTVECSNQTELRPPTTGV